MFTLNEHGEWSHGISVRGGYILEVCLAKWWANIGNVECSYSVTFHGLSPEGREQEVLFHKVDVRSQFTEQDYILMPAILSFYPMLI